MPVCLQSLHAGHPARTAILVARAPHGAVCRRRKASQGTAGGWGESAGCLSSQASRHMGRELVYTVALNVQGDGAPGGGTDETGRYGSLPVCGHYLRPTTRRWRHMGCPSPAGTALPRANPFPLHLSPSVSPASQSLAPPAARPHTRTPPSQAQERCRPYSSPLAALRWPVAFSGAACASQRR